MLFPILLPLIQYESPYSFLNRFQPCIDFRIYSKQLYGTFCTRGCDYLFHKLWRLNLRRSFRGGTVPVTANNPKVLRYRTVVRGVFLLSTTFYFCFRRIITSKMIIMVVGAMLIVPSHIKSSITAPIPKRTVESPMTNLVKTYIQ